MYSIVLGTFIAVKPRPEDCDCYGVSLVIPTGGLLRLLSLEYVLFNFSVFLKEIFSTLPNKLDPITLNSFSVSLNSVTSDSKSVYFPSR